MAKIKDEGPQKLTIVPAPDLNQLELSNAASVDLRLGRWFMTLRGTKTPTLEVLQKSEQPANEIRYTREFYVPFGDTFWLHPKTFVLGTTLEWICLPPGLGGFVGGKSGWGRRGLIIETAASIHPGFTGSRASGRTPSGSAPADGSRPSPEFDCQLFDLAVSFTNHLGTKQRHKTTRALGGRAIFANIGRIRGSASAWEADSAGPS